MNNHFQQKPVIFLAFANDRVDHARYLRNLSQEHRGIRSVLDKAKKAGLCEVLERANAAIDDIMNVFQDENYKDRIAIFHYGGHANDYSVLLESFAGGRVPAYRDGLISFFARQKGIKLVFLNACSTEQHAIELKKAGITAVIGTSQAINDEVATGLAIRFYHGIANGFNLERAWQEAEDYIKIKYGSSNFGALYHWEQQEKHEDRFPWNIYFKEGAEKVKEWNLPDAVNDPLFGLPPLPRTYKLPDKPFLFLNPYQRKHAELFFGRSYYIRELYNRVTDKNSSPIILLYGQTGVGKSSLLEAGLLPRLEESHTLLYIRRFQGKGLLRTLEEALNNHLSPLKKDIKKPTIGKKWKLIEFKTKKPLVIILDQVEQVYTHMNKFLPHDFDDFMAALKTVFENPAIYPGGKLVLGYRKEYHPEIDEQFKRNELDRTRLFLQPLDRQGIVEVVTGLTKTKRLREKYNLKISQEDQLPMIIATELLKDKNSPVAPTLQIILTRMWDTSEKNEFSTVHEFSLDQYQALRKEGLLMEDFFKRQMKKLGNWNREVIESGLALDVLKFHTTELGTACTRDIQEIRRTYPHREDIIADLVKQLEHLYLLTDTRYSKNETSLAHDTLAPIVIKEYNDSDEPGPRAFRILTTKIEGFKKNRDKIWLDDVDLDIVEQGKKGVRVLDPDEKELLEISRECKKQRERRDRIRKKIRVTLIFFIIVFAVVAAWQWKEASDREKIARASSYISKAQLKLKDDPNVAIRLAEKAYYLNENNIARQILVDAAAETLERPFYNLNISHEGAVNSAVFSPSGHRILTASSDNTAKLWDLQGNCLATFRHGAEVYSARFSPDGTKILTASRDKTAKMWDLNGTLLTDLDKHTDVVICAVFSPDGTKILTASYDKTAKVWDLQGKLIANLTGHTNDIKIACFSPDGSKILTASYNNTVIFGDLKNRLSKGFRYGSVCKSLSFSPKGDRILTVFYNNTVKLYDLNGNLLTDFNNHNEIIAFAVFSPDGDQILMLYSDRKAKLFDLRGTPVKEFDTHTKAVNRVVFSPGGNRILVSSENNTVKLLDLEGNLLANLDNHQEMVTSTVFSPDGTRILTTSRDKTAKLWDLRNQPVTNFKRHTDAVTTAVFSPDGSKILTASDDKTVKLWNLPGNLLKDFNPHMAPINSAVFSPDGTKILTASYHNTAKLWDTKGNPLRDFVKHTEFVSSAVFSPDGTKILTSSADGTAKLWDLQGNVLTNIKINSGRRNSAIFSPDGTEILTVSIVVRIWDLKGRPLAKIGNIIDEEYKRRFTGDYSFTSAVFSPNGKRVLTASNDNTAGLWDLKGNLLAKFNGHKGIVNSAVFSLDGKRVLTASADGTAKMWDSNGNLLADFNMHTGIVYAAVFSPDGTRVLTASADRTAKLQYTPEGIIQWLKTGKIPQLAGDLRVISF